MKKFAVLSSFIFAGVTGYSQAYHNNSKPVPIECLPLHIDTTKPMNIDKLLDLPDALKLISCVIAISSKGMIITNEYVPNMPIEKQKPMWQLLKTLHKDDEFILQDILVNRDGKKLKVPNKCFKIQ